MDSRNDLPAKVLIGVGTFFLLSNIIGFNIFAMLWPLFVIVPGLPFLYGALNGGRKATGLIFPGIIITGTGLILLYQSITGHWASWAYIWTLYPVMVGMGLQFQGKTLGSKSEVKTGKGMVTYGLMAFAALALLFEFLIFGGIGMFWSLALLGAGVYLLRNQSSGSSQDTASKRKNDPGSSSSGDAKRKNSAPQDDKLSAVIDPDLERKINAALEEIKTDASNAQNNQTV